MQTKLPNSWAECSFGDIAEIRNGYAFKSSWFKKARESSTDVPLVKQSQLVLDIVDLKDAAYLDNAYLETHSDYVISKGDIIIGMSGSIGKVCEYKYDHPALQNQRTGKIVPITGSLLAPKFFGMFLSNIERTLVEKAKGMGVQNISGKDIQKLPFNLPPTNEQHRIVAKIEELFSELDKGIESLKTAREQLKVYRQALLKHAFEGKLTEHLPSRQAGWRDPGFRNISDKLVPVDSQSYFAYVLVCEGGRLYKGFTSNLFERINQHLSGRGAKFTKEHRPLALLHFEVFEKEQEAIEREKYFKSGSGREWLYALRQQQEEKHPTSIQLLQRIKQEREARYQQQLEDWKAAVKQWSARRTGGEADGLPAARLPDGQGQAGKEGKKPPKPRPSKPLKLESEEAVVLPELPNDWAWLLLGENDVDVFDGPFGSNLKTSDYVDEGVRVVRLENIGAQQFIDEKKSFISEEKYQQLAKHTVQPGDLVFSSFVTENTRVALVPDSIELAVNKADCFCVRTFGDTLDERFLEAYLSTRFVFKSIESLVHGVGRPRINTTQLKSIPIPMTSIAEQREIMEKLEMQLSEVSKLEEEIDSNLAKSEALRQSILKKAFSGQLVPQDPNDGPASVLLDRIAKEKEQACLAGRQAAAKAKPARRSGGKAKMAKKKSKTTRKSKRKAS